MWSWAEIQCDIVVRSDSECPLGAHTSSRHTPMYALYTIIIINWSGLGMVKKISIINYNRLRKTWWVFRQDARCDRINSNVQDCLLTELLAKHGSKMYGSTFGNIVFDVVLGLGRKLTAWGQLRRHFADGRAGKSQEGVPSVRVRLKNISERNRSWLTQGLILPDTHLDDPLNESDPDQI